MAFSDFSNTMSSADFWSGVFSTIAILFILHRVKRPKLVVVGGGGGSGSLEGGESFSFSKMTLSNSPSFFGYPISRETLFVESARIYDPVSKTNEGPLMRWKDASDKKPFCTEIKVGDRAELFVYGIYKQRVHHYVGDTTNRIDRSDTIVEIGQSRRLEIRITDNLQRLHRIRLEITALEKRNSADKVDVTIRVKTNINDRMQQFKEGVSEMIGAFTGPRY